MRQAIVVCAVALALLAACVDTRKEPPPKPFVGTRWVVMLEIPVKGEQPHMRFGDGRMEGFGGCNQISARYVQDTVGSRFIAIGRIESGRRGCERAVQDVENRTIEVLQSVSSYTITGDELVMSGSGGSLKFRAVPEGPKP